MNRLPLAPDAPTINPHMKAMIDEAQQAKSDKARGELSAVGALFAPRSQRLHLIIQGSVVGVFFRAFIERNARELRVTGWVRNTEQRTVEVVAEGTHDVLEALRDRCKKGPEAATVTRLDEMWLPATGEFKAFEIKF